jgi:hypothetical protein
MLIESEPNENANPLGRIEDIPLTEGEQSLVQCKLYKTADKFEQALWELIFVADAINLAKLKEIYPSHLEAYLNYKREPGWFELLIAKLPARRASDSI